MSAESVSLVFTVGLLVLSEALPFLRRRFGAKIPIDGILYGLFAMLYASSCMSDECTERAESAIGRDLDGNGVVGVVARRSSKTNADVICAACSGTGRVAEQANPVQSVETASA